MSNNVNEMDKILGGMLAKLAETEPGTDRAKLLLQDIGALARVRNGIADSDIKAQEADNKKAKEKEVLSFDKDKFRDQMELEKKKFEYGQSIDKMKLDQEKSVYADKKAMDKDKMEFEKERAKSESLIKREQMEFEKSRVGLACREFEHKKTMDEKKFEADTEYRAEQLELDMDKFEHLKGVDDAKIHQEANMNAFRKDMDERKLNFDKFKLERECSVKEKQIKVEVDKLCQARNEFEHREYVDIEKLNIEKNAQEADKKAKRVDNMVNAAKVGTGILEVAASVAVGFGMVCLYTAAEASGVMPNRLPGVKIGSGLLNGTLKKIKL